MSILSKLFGKKSGVSEEIIDELTRIIDRQREEIEALKKMLEKNVWIPPQTVLSDQPSPQHSEVNEVKHEELRKTEIRAETANHHKNEREQDPAREQLHIFKTANASWLSESDYHALLGLMEATIRKKYIRKDDDILWIEDEKSIRVYYDVEEFGYHDKTSGKHYYVEVRRYDDETSHFLWEDSELPCEGQAIVENDSRHETPFGDGHDDEERTVRVLKKLYGSNLYWEFTEYYNSYYY